MGKEILSKPDAIRAAGRNISGIDAKSDYSRFPSALTSSHGLVAEGINEIVVELENVERLVNEMLGKFPKKLDDVSKTIEESDNAAAKQFK